MPHALDNSTLQVRIASPEDWDVFLDWCTAEGWIISDPERYLLQNQWQSCFKVLWEKDHRRAFISVIRYPRSAWIGNLIVDPDLRGCGYGSLLFNAELEALDTAGMEQVWLTASAMGMPLYLKHDFTRIDDCDRWMGTGMGTVTGQLGAGSTCAQKIQDLIGEDARAWGESHQKLLESLADFSMAVTSEKFTTLLQPGSHSWHVGPWIGRDIHANISPADIEDFIRMILKNTPRGQTLSVDVIKSSKLGVPLHQAGFHKTGSSVLMCRTRGQINLPRVYALASLGSIG
jgi:GNAT superfamily N-acetyltransferase